MEDKAVDLLVLLDNLRDKSTPCSDIYEIVWKNLCESPTALTPAAFTQKLRTCLDEINQLETTTVSKQYLSMLSEIHKALGFPEK